MEPKIRFSEFVDNWKNEILGNVTPVKRGVRVTRKDLNSQGKYPVYQNTDYPMGFYNEYNVKGNSPFVIIGGSAGLIGFSHDNFWAADDCAYFGECEDLDNVFLYNLLLRQGSEIKKNVRGSSVPRLDRKIISDLLISMPSLNEQRQIGNYFLYLDSLIQSTTKKIESLKQVKAASLQSMFPQEGETTPRVRFKGFEGDWEKAIIRDICSFTKGQGYSKSDLKNEGCPIILYGRMYTSYSFEMNDIDTFAKHKEGAVYSKGNEVIIPASGETAEDIAIAAAVRQKGVILGGDLNILVFNDGYDPSFMALLISYSKTHYELSKYAQGKSVVHLRNNDIANGHVTCPSMEEQKQISSFFSKLDSQITLLSQRLEKLKQIKSACLENMFV